MTLPAPDRTLSIVGWQGEVYSPGGGTVIESVIAALPTEMQDITSMDVDEYPTEIYYICYTMTWIEESQEWIRENNPIFTVRVH